VSQGVVRIGAALARLRELGSELLPATRETEIGALEQRWGCRLPPVYRALLIDYKFPPLLIGEVELFGNGCDNSDDDIASASVRDKHLFAWLASRGALQIGRPATGAYDPVCFGMAGAANDPPVVVFNHEDILQGRAKVRCRTIADSFAKLLGLF
jgi:hypothetical protein